MIPSRPRQIRLAYKMLSAMGENAAMLCTVDANNAGSGELSIVVNNGSVPSTARLVAQNIYSVSFMPTEPGIYTVELFFNCQPLKGSIFLSYYCDLMPFRAFSV